MSLMVSGGFIQFMGATLENKTLFCYIMCLHELCCRENSCKSGMTNDFLKC